MSQGNEDFNALLLAVRRGEHEAVVDLVRLYEAEVRRVARVMLGPLLRHMLDSVDLVQSVHRSLMLHLRRGEFDIDSPERLRQLALTMVRRKIARQWRRLKRQTALPGDESREGGFGRPALAAGDPSQTAADKETFERVLARLSEVDRRLVELRLMGHNTASAARILGMDPDVLRVRLSRLRRQLGGGQSPAAWL